MRTTGGLYMDGSTPAHSPLRPPRTLPPRPGPDAGLRLRAAGLIALLALLMAGMGWLWAGPTGIVLALAVAGAEGLLLPVAGPRTVMRMLRGRPLPLMHAPELHAMAETLARRAGLAERPMLFVTPSPAVEALAVSGRGDTPDAVALSSGTLSNLTPREVEGVLAHEMSHLAAGDIRLFRLVGGMATSVRVLGLAGTVFAAVLLVAADPVPGLEWLIVAFLAAPLIATVAEAALWRVREYAADACAVTLTGDPRGLASALRRIESLHGNPLWRLFRGLRRTPETAGPLRTHPQTADRIARLLKPR